MTTTTTTSATKMPTWIARLARRWPTVLALISAVVCAVVILGLDADVEFAAGSSS